MEVGPAGVDQVVERWDPLREFVPGEVGDAALAHPSDHAIVLEHGDPVAGEPHVALETIGPHLERELEGGDRVLGGVGSGTSVGERDRVVEQGRKSLLHAPPSWQALRRLVLRRLPACSTCKAAS